MATKKKVSVGIDNPVEFSVRIFVIGDTGHHNTLSIVRCFGEGGLNVELLSIGDFNGCATKSKYVLHTWNFKTYNDAIDFIVKIQQECTDKLFVICCSDESAHQLDLHHAELCDKIEFFRTERQGQLTKYMDKQEQAQLAKMIGFNVPQSSMLYGNIKHEFDRFPCILKPLESINGGKKIRICSNQKELNNILSDFPHNQKILVQQFIERDAEIVVVGLSTEKETIIPAYIEKLRDNNGGTTYSQVRKCSRLDSDILMKCKTMPQKIGYRGLFGIELIQSGDLWYFIEINLRNDATCYSIAKGGYNLPMAYVNYATNVATYIEAKNEINEIFSIVELKDFKFVIKRKVNLFKWLKQLSEAKCKYYYNSKDRKPFFYAVREILLRPFHNSKSTK